MLFRRRRRFADLIERQLALFARDHVDELRLIAAARARYDRVSREGADEAFGDYQDLVDWAAEDLERLRDGYCSTLDADAAIEYRAAYAKAVRRRFGVIADLLDDLR